jgi:hypothetical protein
MPLYGATFDENESPPLEGCRGGFFLREDPPLRLKPSFPSPKRGFWLKNGISDLLGSQTQKTQKMKARESLVGAHVGPPRFARAFSTHRVSPN